MLTTGLLIFSEYCMYYLLDPNLIFFKEQQYNFGVSYKIFKLFLKSKNPQTIPVQISLFLMGNITVQIKAWPDKWYFLNPTVQTQIAQIMRLFTEHQRQKRVNYERCFRMCGRGRTVF